MTTGITQKYCLHILRPLDNYQFQHLDLHLSIISVLYLYLQPRKGYYLQRHLRRALETYSAFQRVAAIFHAPFTRFERLDCRTHYFVQVIATHVRSIFVLPLVFITDYSLGTVSVSSLSSAIPNRSSIFLQISSANSSPASNSILFKLTVLS